MMRTDADRDFVSAAEKSKQLKSGEPDMRIRRNLAVLSHDWALKDAGRCDQQLVGRIAMERLRQLGGFHHDLRMEVKKGHARFRKGAFYPKPDGPIELQPSVLHKFRDFPTGDDANAEDAIRAKFEKLAVPRLQPIRSRNPPNPNVGVQQNHSRASQSSPATGSNGSRNSKTESRRLWPPAAFDPAVFETTNTSTGWPGANGRPCKTTSPCSPTVVSLQCACTPSL